MPLPEQLQGYADVYRQSKAEAHAVVDGLDDEAFNWKPSPKSWSVGECLVHLNKIAEAYLPVMEAAVEAGGPAGTPPFQYGWVSRKFTDAVRPGARAVKTMAPMKPPETQDTRSAIDRGRALDEFDALTDRYVALVERSAGLDLSRIRARSPFLWLMRLPVGAFLDALGQHALRHVGQAERVTRTPGFPAS